MVELETKSRTLSFAFPEDFFSRASRITILPGSGNKLEQQFLCDEDAMRLNSYKHNDDKFLLMNDGKFYKSFISNPVEMYMDDPYMLFLEFKEPGTYYVDVMCLHHDYVRLFKEVKFYGR